MLHLLDTRRHFRFRNDSIIRHPECFVAKHAAHYCCSRFQGLKYHMKVSNKYLRNIRWMKLPVKRLKTTWTIKSDVNQPHFMYLVLMPYFRNFSSFKIKKIKEDFVSLCNRIETFFHCVCKSFQAKLYENLLSA